MDFGLIVIGILGIVLSSVVGWFLFSKLGPIFNSLSDAFARQRMDEMRESLLNISGSSIIMGLVVLLLFSLLALPCIGCLFSFMFIGTGLGLIR